MGPTNKQLSIPENGEAKMEIVPATPTPLTVLREAVKQGVSVETLTQLLALQERFEANEARKAFVRALAVFKANPPTLEKDKEVAFKDVRYKYTPLDKCASVIGTALAKHGLSFRWETKQIEGRVSVTCVLQHEQGHNERVTLESTPDNSGSKNSIQAIGSAVTYLERYTLLAITGIATANQDTDGMTMNNADDFIANMEAATNLEELAQRYKEAQGAALRANDPAAVKVFMQYRDKRSNELRVA